MPLPTTPNKADDGIERIKRDLEAKWGFRFAQRDLTWSPQKADPKSSADRAQTALTYLYYQDKAALSFALAEFDRHALAIKSRWVFKPKADSNVLPTSRHPSDFLSRQDELPPEAQEQLMACLYAKLKSSADKLKSGQLYTAPGCVVESVESRAEHALTNTKEDESSRLQRKPSRLHRQAQLPTSWLRSKSEGDPSQLSDDFQDSQIESLLSEVPMQDAAGIVGDKSTPSRTKQPAVNAPLEDKEVFKTPPTTPPPSTSPMVPPRTRTPLTRDKSISAPNINSFTSFLKPVVPNKPNPPIDQPGRKRSRPEQERQESPRKFSRDSSTSSVLSSVSSSNRLPKFPSYYNRDTAWSFSTDTANSMASSMTSAPSSITTPNTSFSSLSRNASFDTSDDTDATIRASFIKPKLQSPERKTTAVNLTEQLAQSPPFGDFVPLSYSSRPLRQLYEVTRVALSCQLDLAMFERTLRGNITDYDTLWRSLTSIVAAEGCTMPERSSRAAWNKAEDFNGVSLSGGLAFADKPNVFRFTLNPLRIERTHRLGREFGNDRFCVISFPSLSSSDLPQSLRSDPIATRQALITWLTETSHRFLGRSWRAFLPKPAPMKRGSRLGQSSQANDRFRIHMFAEDGRGFRSDDQVGETDPRADILIHKRMTRQQLLEWFMPAKVNRNQSALKFFARLQLGVSKTIPTMVFHTIEIHRTPDALAHHPCVRKLKPGRTNHGKEQLESAVMNDGCARISRNAARAIADMLDLDSVPCAFQGRFAGAKGMWMVDVNDEKPRTTGRGFWIEITDSQLKFEGNPVDTYAPQINRTTFEVHDYVKRLQPSSLSFQLMIILENCGVPPDVFIHILREDLTTRVGELQVIMESRLRLALWNQQNNPVSKQRSTKGGIEMQGGLPVSNAEKINWFLEHGFETQTCKFLADLLFDAIHSYCLRLEEKMDVTIGQSTFAFMLADPLAVLEENEVQLSFSHAFQDSRSGFDETMLHELDVLVARLPAHLPSDVQKVRAVFKPELRIYRDAIVFPSKGPLSLASKLSGGDYDGDKAWVCWDDRIVKPFQNAPLFQAPPMEAYGISKDTARVADFLDKGGGLTSEFTRHGFDFNLQYSLLGSCTNYHEAYCYSPMGKPLDHPKAMEIAGLLGLLVDSAKGGFIFDESKWTSYLNSKSLPSPGVLKKPAYKDPKGQQPTKHLIDRLVFDVARTVRKEALKDFSDRIKDVPQKDPALVRLRNDEYAAAKDDPALISVLKNLESALEIIGNDWSAMAGNRREEENPLRQRNRKSAPDSMSFAAVCENCRTNFLHIAPTITSSGSEATALVASDRIREWQRKHKANESSYWDLLKASVLFSKWRGNVAWYTAGIELGEIKAMSEGRGTYRAVCDEIFAALKIDSKYVDRVRRREAMEERGDDDGDGDDDDDDEFGSMAWMNDL